MTVAIIPNKIPTPNPTPNPIFASDVSSPFPPLLDPPVCEDTFPVPLELVDPIVCTVPIEVEVLETLVFPDAVVVDEKDNVEDKVDALCTVAAGTSEFFMLKIGEIPSEFDKRI